MIERGAGRAVRGILAGLAAAAAVVGAAPGAGEDLEIFAHFSSLAGGRDVGVGGDGTLVFFTSFFSIVPDEDPITAEGLADKPFLANNADLFTWDPSRDEVLQFTKTSNIETSDGDAVLSFTFNDQPAVETRTVPVFGPGDAQPTRERTTAVAFRSNADQAIVGPTTTVDDVDPRVAALGATGSTIYVWDSQRDSMDSVFEFILTPATITLGAPSLSMRSRIVMEKVAGHQDEVATGLEIRDVLVAFSGNANPADDNDDGNSEIFLWSRKRFLEDGQPGGGGLRNGGITQITHTVDGECSSPAVSPSGAVAFLSTADVTGENPDGSVELFVWRRGSFRQLTNIASGTIGAPRWAAGGRTLVFEAAADIVRKNPDESSEIFLWDGRRIRQLTEGTTGGSFSPSTDARGRAVAFVTDADVLGGGAAPASGAREVVLADRTGRDRLQVTFSGDGFDNEAPHLTGGDALVRLTWISSSNLDGRNSNNNRRVYRTMIRARP